MIVLHYDADFDTIAAVTKQEVEWVAPRGSLKASFLSGLQPSASFFGSISRQWPGRRSRGRRTGP